MCGLWCLACVGKCGLQSFAVCEITNYLVDGWLICVKRAFGLVYLCQVFRCVEFCGVFGCLIFNDYFCNAFVFRALKYY